MELAVAALQAVGLFLVTNIDDIIVLSLFFARGAGAPGATAKIIAGRHTLTYGLDWHLDRSNNADSSTTTTIKTTTRMSAG